MIKLVLVSTIATVLAIGTLTISSSKITRLENDIDQLKTTVSLEQEKIKMLYGTRKEDQAAITSLQSEQAKIDKRLYSATIELGKVDNETKNIIDTPMPDSIIGLLNSVNAH